MKTYGFQLLEWICDTRSIEFIPEVIGRNDISSYTRKGASGDANEQSFSGNRIPDDLHGGESLQILSFPVQGVYDLFIDGQDDWVGMVATGIGLSDDDSGFVYIPVPYKPTRGFRTALPVRTCKSS